jgi:hypothetical protein
MYYDQGVSDGKLEYGNAAITLHCLPLAHQLLLVAAPHHLHHFLHLVRVLMDQQVELFRLLRLAASKAGYSGNDSRL